MNKIFLIYYVLYPSGRYGATLSTVNEINRMIKNFELARCETNNCIFSLLIKKYLKKRNLDNRT